MKYCTKCRRSLDREWFGSHKGEPDGRQRHCYQCNTKRQAARAAVIRAKYRRLVKLPMLAKGCAWCGYNWCEDALHLDHLAPNDPDKFGGHQSMGQWVNHNNPLPREIKAEMEKCQILCANCHAERTRQQRESGELKMGRPYSPNRPASDPPSVHVEGQLSLLD